VNVHFESDILDYQTLRAMAYATYGGAEPGEVLVTAERIDTTRPGEWHAEWSRTAERVLGVAEDAAESGNRRTARGAYFRAHNYFRTAEFFLSPDDERRPSTYERSVEAFRAGAGKLPRPPERLSIPYEGGSLPGYLFLPHRGTRAAGANDERGRTDGTNETGTAAPPFPTVVCIGGFDSICEELYFACGVPEALARGYAVVCFEGPGQGAPLREDGLSARPDWEHVVGPVLDALGPRPELDADRFALIGLSFGGYYAPRAAAFDDRVAACVAFDHMHDLYRAAAGESPRAAAIFQRAPDTVINAVATLGERVSAESRWLMDNGRWVFGVESAAEYMRTIQEYSLTGVAGDIDCPTLVLAGEDDHFVSVDLAREFADEVGEPATLRVFETASGAGEHCQSGNLSMACSVIYDWLDGALEQTAGRRPGHDRDH
jgi:pimeloyl-ACP methyl ester carboxylesterase